MRLPSMDTKPSSPTGEVMTSEWELIVSISTEINYQKQIHMFLITFTWNDVRLPLAGSSFPRSMDRRHGDVENIADGTNRWPGDDGLSVDASWLVFCVV